LQQKDSEIQNLKQELNGMEYKIDKYESQLSECNKSLQIAQSELFRRKSFSSRSYMNGILTESYNSIEDAYDACKRKVSDLEDELRRCKNGW
jgi:chromosome segregation ATPase